MTIPMSDVRERLALCLSEQLGDEAESYARFICGEEANEAGAPVPCWGAIFERFIEAFQSVDERRTALEGLISAGDSRPLFLFVHLARGDDALWQAVVDAACRLPVALQRLVASLQPREAWPDAWARELAAEARQTGCVPELRVREVEQFEARLGELLSFAWFLPSAAESHPE